MSQNGKCPACLSPKNSPAGTKNNFELVFCGSCGTLFAEIVPDDRETAEQVKQIYDHYYDFAEYKLPRATELSLQKIADSFGDFRQTGNLLDIGFGEGGMLTIAEQNGWQCFGTELSPQSLKYGESRGWTVSNDAISDERFRKNEFDVVTMVELIEHVPNPDFFLETAFQLLRPGGLLFLTTPNTNSINRRWLGTDWSMISPPEHITIWSVQGLKKALDRNHFSIRQCRTEGFNPVEILGKYRSRSADDAPINRNEAAFALNEAFASSPWRQAVKTTINRGLSLVKLGDGIKIWATKK